MPQPGYGGGMPPPASAGPKRTSGMAIISLICGILGCFIVTGIAAVITGILAVRATSRDPQLGGRGLALAGIITGVLFGLGGTSCLTAGGIIGFFANDMRKASQTTIDFVDRASHGDEAGATKLVDTQRLPQAEVTGVIRTLKFLGPPKQFDPGVPVVKRNGDVTTAIVTATIRYAMVSTPVVFELEKQSDGTFKITKITLSRNGGNGGDTSAPSDDSTDQ